MSSANDSKYMLCGFQTFQKSHLKHQTVAVHEGKQFNRPECEYKAKRKDSLASHQKAVHMGQKFHVQSVIIRPDTKVML